MKKAHSLFFTVLMINTLFSACLKNSTTTEPTSLQDTGKYINGSYQGQTEIDYESYHALASVEVTRGRIAVVDWQIYDNNRERFFDETYEEVYAGNDHYIQQCRDNMVGMVAFGPKLIETQDINEVDNITGATWCYNKFKEVIGITLENARADTTGIAE